ncbi:MAG: monovalent cation/H+ antiporter subunit D family protein [Thermodesulfobacteriota bacterium]
MIAAQYPVLILAIPLLTAFAISIFGRRSDRLCWLLLTGAMAGSFFCAVNVLLQVVHGGPIRYHIGDWPPPIGIELAIDHLNAMVLSMVSGVALFTALFSLKTVPGEVPFRRPGEKVAERLPNFYTLYALLVTGLLGMVATGDAFNLYVLLEITALSGYALLALGGGRAYLATFKYIILGTIGACLYLLGVGYLYIKTGSLNMADLAGLIAAPDLQASASIRVAFLLIITGVFIKMGLFPLHGWLPNAYALAPNTASCLVAPLVTKVSVYIMIRMMFSVFNPHYVFTVVGWQQAVMATATAAIFFGSVAALAQRDLKRMLTYIIVAEVGYMVGGVWMADASGLTGATYHILADGAMTSCLFMAVSAIVYRRGDSSFAAMEHLFQRMPITGAVFVVGALAMIGIPPTCGFFSKWYLLQGALASGQYPYLAALLFSSLVNALMFFRLFEIAYFGREPAEGHGQHPPKVAVAEAPFAMLVPMVITATLLVVIGLYTGEIVTSLISRTIPAGL